MAKKISTSAKDVTRCEVPMHPLAACTPRGDRVVVRRDMTKTETDGGLLLPESAERAKRPTGTIITVGPGIRLADGTMVPLDLKVGDRVILTNYAGLEVKDPFNFKYHGDEYVLLREEDVLATLPKGWKE